MTKFEKFKCPKCESIQLKSNAGWNSLIVKIICRNCGYEQTLCNLLGPK